MKVIDLPIGSKDWKNYRRRGIGASESSIILGISPFATPYQLWEQKVYGIEQPDNPAMKRGRERESEALEYAKKTLGIELKPKMIEHPEYPFLFATLDGIDLFGEIVVEIKWGSKSVHSTAQMGQVVDHYFCQCQQQMACAGLDKMYFLSCQETIGQPDFCLIEVKRDDLFIEKMIEKEKEFYEKYLSQEEPPPFTDKDYVKISEENACFFNQLMETDMSIAQEIKTLQERRDAIKKDLLNLCGDKSCKTDLFKATKFRVKGAVQYDKIPELQNINLESYRKESREQWRFSKNG